MSTKWEKADAFLKLERVLFGSIFNQGPNFNPDDGLMPLRLWFVLTQYGGLNSEEYNSWIERHG